VANTILLKRSSTGGSIPSTSDGSLGELIINTNDGRLYTKINNGSASIIDLTQNDKITLSGDATGTSTNPAAGSGYSNLAVTLSSTGVSAGTYGSGASVPTIVVDSKGRITSVTTNAISTSFTISGTSGSQVIAGGSYLTLAGTYGVGIEIGENFNTKYANISTPQDLQTTASPTFAGATAGDITISGNSISSTNSVISIDPSTAGSGGTVIIAGNLQVTGTTTTVNSTTVDVADLNITLAKGSANGAAADGAGITIDGASATFTYASTGDKWTMNKPLSITGGVTTSANTAVNSTLYAQGVYDESNRVLTTASSFGNNGGDASVSGGYASLALTLATVNTNVGSFGNATYGARATVNGKGLVTAVTESKITPAFADITNTPTSLSGYGITDALSTSATIDGGTY
jgi:hypothetical protein